ncbi:MAG: triosephosphate isomerase, partial [Actinomycetales bacterium]
MFYFGSNTKRNLGLAAHQEITQAALDLAKSYSDVQFFLLPSIPFFRELQANSEGTSLWIGNQSISSTGSQDVTGEVSAQTLKTLNSDLVMIAHAERRHLFDGDTEIAAQLKAAESEDLRVLFCIGESVQAHDFEALRKLLQAQLGPLAHRSLDLIIAYEPVFSIGVDGVPADPQYVDKVSTIIKEELSELSFANTPLLYGGSVDVHNAALYGALKACDGLFVGRSAWNPK